MPEIAVSQLPSSSETAVLKQTAVSDIRNKSKRYFREDLKPGFRQHLRLKLQDPFTQGANGGFKLSVLWGGLGALGVLVLSVFLYFNFLRS